MNSTNKVAFNTILQYVHLVVNVLLGLVTVRLILNALGTIDYGIYSLMGGIIVLLSFISSSLSQTSIRFISVSLGRKEDNIVKQTFRSCFSLHFYMAVILSVILEFIGLFLFDGALNIPESRIGAAALVFHCMVFTLFLNIAITPFSALIVAHERFVVSVSIGIIDSVLKLLIAIAVLFYDSDKLVLYAILKAFVVVFNITCYAFYCEIHYNSQMSLVLQSPKRLGNITGFAGLTLLDVLGTTLDRQGYAVMLNKFFGPATNTIYALAGQVEGHLYSISSSVINTIKPQIMKSFGAGDRLRALRLSMTAGKVGFSMMSLLSVPLLVMMPYILQLWLKDVPEDTALFARLMVAACMCEQLTRGLVYANQANGNIKWFSIIVSSVRVSALPISIIALFCGAEAYVAILIFAFSELAGSFCRVWIMSKIAGLNAKEFIETVLFHILPPFMVSFTACLLSWNFAFNETIIGVFISTFIAAVSYILLFYFVGMTKEEKCSVDTILGTLKKRVVR